MKKTLPAIFVALFMTVILVGGMLVLGGDALSVTSVAAAAGTPAATLTGDLSQLQQLLVEYQVREAQYQQQLNDAAERISTADQQLEQANQQIQQYQSVLNELQNQGVITLADDGTITVNQVFAPPQSHDHGGRP